MVNDRPFFNICTTVMYDLHVLKKMSSVFQSTLYCNCKMLIKKSIPDFVTQFEFDFILSDQCDGFIQGIFKSRFLIYYWF